MTQYKFDMRSGHYYAINEGEQPNADQQETEEQPAEETQKAALVNLNTEDVVQVQKQMSDKLASIQKDIDLKNNNAMQIEKKLADIVSKEDTDQQAINKLQSQLLQIRYEESTKKFEKAKVQNDFEKKIFILQKKLVESMTAKYILPEKYKNLNESNIQNAKIHISKLIDDDCQQRISGMVDFKKAFGNSELLYGKDKNGFYAVCIDQADFNKLTNTLEEVGFLRDEILQVTLPQLFDRTNLTK